jgi:GDP-4-dehydro-6-deoxy-D-mannose reductase
MAGRATMRILISGAGGFAGRHLIAALRRHFGLQCSLLAIEARPVQHSAPVDRLTQLVVADLRDAVAVGTVVQRFAPQVVINLAAISSVSEAHSAATAAYEINVNGAVNLARAMADVSPGALFVQASTVDVYGAAFLSGIAATERTGVLPQNPYARSKLAAECALQDIAAAHCRVVALRLGNHIGPGQDERFVAPSFAAQIARIEAGQTPAVLRTGDLTAERDFMDVEDAARAYVALLALEHPKTGYACYNVASGASRSIKSVLDGLLQLSQAAIRIEQDPARMRPSDIPIAKVSSDAFRAKTGWTPKVPFQESLESLLAHWREQVAGQDKAGLLS